MTRWHKLAASMALTTLAGCFSSVVDGRADDDGPVPSLPDLGAVDATPPEPEPEPEPPPASCEPVAEEPPEFRFVEIGEDADCTAEAFAESRSVMLTDARIQPDGTLRFELLTSLVRDGDYRCGLEVRGLGADAERVLANFGTMRFSLLQVRDAALALLPNDIFCEAPLCPLPIGLWLGRLMLPAEGPLPAVDWLRLEAGEAECVVPSRCSQARFPLRVGGREIDLSVSPGAAGEATLVPPVLGAERIVVRVYASGIDCGPADGASDPFVSGLVYTLRE